MIEKIELWQNDKKIDDIEIEWFRLEWEREWHKGFKKWREKMEVFIDVILMGDSLYDVYCRNKENLRNPITLKTNEFEINTLFLFEYAPYFDFDLSEIHKATLKLIKK